MAKISFKADLEKLIEKYNVEYAFGDTSNEILAGFLIDCLEAYSKASRQRDMQWQAEAENDAIEEQQSQGKYEEWLRIEEAKEGRKLTGEDD